MFANPFAGLAPFRGCPPAAGLVAGRAFHLDANLLEHFLGYVCQRLTPIQKHTAERDSLRTASAGLWARMSDHPRTATIIGEARGPLHLDGGSSTV